MYDVCRGKTWILLYAVGMYVHTYMWCILCHSRYVLSYVAVERKRLHGREEAAEWTKGYSTYLPWSSG